MIEVVDVIRIDANLAGECFEIEHRRVLAAVAVQPREIGEREGFVRTQRQRVREKQDSEESFHPSGSAMKR